METTDIAWLAGIIDGEGSLALTTRKAARGAWPVLFIYNSSLPLIDKAERIIRDLGVEPRRIKLREPRNGLSRLSLAGLHVNKGLPIVLAAVIPHLASRKRGFAEDLLILDAMRSFGTRWTDEQLAFAETLRETHMPRSVPASLRGTLGPSSSVLDGMT